MPRRPFRPSRRELLIGGTALGALGLAGCGPQETLSGLLDDVAVADFPLGASSGDVVHDRAVLWTRYLGDARLELELALDGGGRPKETVLVREVTPGEGGFIHAEVEGLVPGAVYHYSFRQRGGQAQTVEGRFRAAAAPGSLERMVFSASSCSKNGRAFGTLSHLGHGADVDLHLLLGDTVYADGSNTLDDFREKWRQNLSTGAYRRLRRTRSVLAAWDDHEITNDWSGDAVAQHKRERGIAAFFEHTPMRRNPEAPNRIWRSVKWGDTAEFFILDGRSERRPDTRGSAQAEYLSVAQLSWLKQALAHSRARFKVLVNSVPIGAFPGVFEAWTKDQWVGYAAQREELLSFVEREVEGAFFLSGDFHMASLNFVSMRGAGTRLLEVLTGASATSAPNPFAELCTPPQFVFATTAQNVATFFLDPVKFEVGVRWTGADGAVIAERKFRPT